MAVYAAHLTRTLQGTPSVFQVTAQEALGATVKPALRKVFEYLSAVFPNKLRWTLEWYDELYLLMDGCLQYHYLKHYAASFSENFYGLLRVPLSGSSEFSSGVRLPATLERASLLLIVLVPYLRGKVDTVVERWREQHEDGKLGKSTSARLRVAATRLHSVLHLVCECARLIQLARYLSDSRRAHSAPLCCLGLALRAAPPGEGGAGGEGGWGELASALRGGDLRRCVVTFPMLGSALLSGAEYGAFLVQFLRWWESSAPLPPPALPPPAPSMLAPPEPPGFPHENEDRSVRCRNKCPLCLHSWQVPTVLPVSGYTFCYKCISRHLRAASACPVTRLPASEHQLVRLYVD